MYNYFLIYQISDLTMRVLFFTAAAVAACIANYGQALK